MKSGFFSSRKESFQERLFLTRFSVHYSVDWVDPIGKMNEKGDGRARLCLRWLERLWANNIWERVDKNASLLIPDGSSFIFRFWIMKMRSNAGLSFETRVRWWDRCWFFLFRIFTSVIDCKQFGKFDLGHLKQIIDGVGEEIDFRSRVAHFSWRKKNSYLFGMSLKVILKKLYLNKIHLSLQDTVCSFSWQLLILFH